MLKFTKEEIAQELRERGYENKMSELVAAELIIISEKLHNLLNDWIDDPLNEGDYGCEGYSIAGLMKTRKMLYPAALLTIDWILKEPDEALASVKRRIK